MYIIFNVHFSLFFANDLLLAVYFIFIQTVEVILDKKQIRGIFKFKFKMGCKAVAATWHINNTFGPGTANKCTVQWWFKKFCKGDESFEDEKHSGQPLEVDNDQLIVIIKADPLKTT